MNYAPLAFSAAMPIRGLVERAFLRIAMRLAKRYREYSPLQRIGTIHVAAFAFVARLRDRWGIARRLDDEYLLFLSNFDGGVTQYLSDFSSLIPDEIDAIWGKCVRYPGARDADALARWLGAHQFTGDDKEEHAYVYSGYEVVFGQSAPTMKLVAPPCAPPSPSPLLQATVPMVLNALALRERLRALKQLLEGGASDAELLRAMFAFAAATPHGLASKVTK
jgi:hypothetical protein